MFDFEKLEVYKKAKSFNKDVLVLMKNTKSIDPDKELEDEFGRRLYKYPKIMKNLNG